MKAAKACQVYFNQFALFQHLGSTFNMNQNKVSNLFGNLKDKYGEDCARLLRNWELTIKKMVDNRNHRFILRCIKAGITPASCEIKNPLRNKSIRSYNIIHKVEKELLHERIRKLNNILYMYEHNRCMYYSQLRNMVTESEIYMCIHLIDRIKEHRHNKVKARQINKFKCLVVKNKGRSGYLDSFTRHSNSAIFDNTNENNSLGRRSSQSNPSSSSTHPTTPTGITTNTTTTTDAAPNIPAPSADSNNTSTQNKWVINLTNTPLLQHKKHC